MHIMLHFYDMQNTTFEMLLISNNTATIEAIIFLKSWPRLIKLFYPLCAKLAGLSPSDTRNPTSDLYLEQILDA